MNDSVNKPERATQNRVVQLFTGPLQYRTLGDWGSRTGNHYIEEGPLTAHLQGRTRLQGRP